MTSESIPGGEGCESVGELSGAHISVHDSASADGLQVACDSDKI